MVAFFARDPRSIPRLSAGVYYRVVVSASVFALCINQLYKNPPQTEIPDNIFSALCCAVDGEQVIVTR